MPGLFMVGSREGWNETILTATRRVGAVRADVPAPGIDRGRANELAAAEGADRQRLTRTARPRRSRGLGPGIPVRSGGREAGNGVGGPPAAFCNDQHPW